MRPTSAALIAALGLAAAGCTAGTEAQEDVGFVLLDRDAQAAGRLTHADWEGRPLLPVALEVSEPVTFASTEGASTFNLTPHALAWIHGAGGSIEWLKVGDEVSADRIQVSGSRDAAEDLARRLAGEVSGGSDGLWTVTAPDVFERGSFLAVPAGVLEVSPMRELDVKPAPGRAIRLNAASADVPAAARQLTLVGVYTASDRTLYLDSAGGFSIEEGCGSEPFGAGRWHIEGDQVILEQGRTLTMLAYDAVHGELHDTAGRRFSNLIADSAAAPLPSEGEP